MNVSACSPTQHQWGHWIATDCTKLLLPWFSCQKHLSKAMALSEQRPQPHISKSSSHPCQRNNTPFLSIFFLSSESIPSFLPEGQEEKAAGVNARSVPPLLVLRLKSMTGKTISVVSPYPVCWRRQRAGLRFQDAPHCDQLCTRRSVLMFFPALGSDLLPPQTLPSPLQAVPAHQWEMNGRAFLLFSTTREKNSCCSPHLLGSTPHCSFIQSI